MLNNMFCCVFIVSLISVVVFAAKYLYGMIKNKPCDSRALTISVIALAISFVGFGITMHEIDEPNDTETKVEEKVVEPKEDKEERKEEVVEPEEDGYLNDNPIPNENNMSDVDNYVQTTLNDSYDSNHYKVEFTRDGNEIYIGIMSYDVNLNGQSEEDIENAMSQTGIREAHDDLAQGIKDVYSQYEFDVNVTIGLFDCNQNMFYITEK